MCDVQNSNTWTRGIHSGISEITCSGNQCNHAERTLACALSHGELINYIARGFT